MTDAADEWSPDLSFRDWHNLITTCAESEGLPQTRYMARIASRVTLRAATQLMGLRCTTPSLEALARYLTAWGYESPPIGHENDGAGEWLDDLTKSDANIAAWARRKEDEDECPDPTKDTSRTS